MSIHRLFIALVFPFIAVGTAGFAEEWEKVPDKLLERKTLEEAPDADAYYVFMKSRLFLLSDASLNDVRMEEYARLKILTRKGLDEANIKLYGWGDTRIKDIKARAVNPDGTVIELPNDSVFKTGYDNKYETNTVSFAVPGVKTGAVIEYKATRYYDDWPNAASWSLQRRLFIKESTFIFTVGKGIEFTTVDRNPYNLDLERFKSKDARGNNHGYRIIDTPAIEYEPYRPGWRILSATVQVVFRDLTNEKLVDLGWKRINKSYLDWLNTSKCEGTTLGEIVKEVADVAETEREKAELIYEYVRDNYDLGPVHSLDTMQERLERAVKTKTGDSYANTYLYYLLLEEAGFDPRYVLVCTRDYDIVNPQVPSSLQFNERLIKLNIGGEDIYSLVTEEYLPFGMLPRDYRGTQAFVIKKDGGELIDIPYGKYDENVLQYNCGMVIGADGGIRARAEVTFKGQHYVDILRDIHGMAEPEIKEYFKDWLEERVVDARTTSCSFKDKKDGGYLVAEFTSDAYSAVAGDKIILNPNLMVRHYNPFVEKPSRKYPLWLEYPERINEVVTLIPPPGYSLEKSFDTALMKKPFGAYSVRIVQRDNLLYVREYILGTAEFNSGERMGEVKKLFDYIDMNDVKEIVLGK